MADAYRAHKGKNLERKEEEEWTRILPDCSPGSCVLGGVRRRLVTSPIIFCFAAVNRTNHMLVRFLLLLQYAALFAFFITNPTH